VTTDPRHWFFVLVGWGLVGVVLLLCERFPGEDDE
jgi:hypothetical protein